MGVRSKTITAIKKKYSARNRSVLFPKVKTFAGKTRELLDESILIRAIVKISQKYQKIESHERECKEKHLAPK